MVVTNNAKNRIRDLLAADITSAKVGTDGTDPTAGDTDLGAAVSGVVKTPTVTTSNKTIQISTTILSTEANSETLKEAGVYINTSTLLDRFVYPDFNKTSSNELTIIDVINIL